MIILKGKEEKDKMRKSNRIVAKLLYEIESKIKPGVSTYELDRFAEDLIIKEGAIPGFKGYKGFPATLCISINEEIVHGIPSKDRFLEEGDIVSIDVGTIVDGFYGDGARTYGVGNIDEGAKKLMEITEEALYKGIDAAVAGNRLSDISHAVQEHVEGNGFSVVRQFVGHGIGRNLHEDPQIPNYGPPGRGPELRVGMTLAIEPMVCEGSYDVEILSDGWTAVCKDRSRAAHFEHTIFIEEDGPEILTRM